MLEFHSLVEDNFLFFFFLPRNVASSFVTVNKTDWLLVRIGRADDSARVCNGWLLGK